MKLINVRYMPYYVYIMATYKNGTLYVGRTINIKKRVYMHKHNFVNFTSQYQVHRLVYFEELEDFNKAYVRELQMKKWNRKWKIELIEKNNPDWLDLSEKL